MLQKELAKRLKARYDTKMDGSGWLEVSSDGIPLCRIKYNGQFLSNADQNLSDEYRSKIADIQDEISTVREYVGLYERAPQMQADGVSDYRQLATFGDTVLAATYLSLTEFEKQLPKGHFSRCHNSFLVNLSRVKEIGRTDLTLRNGDMLPVGRTYYKAFQSAFIRYINQ